MTMQMEWKTFAEVAPSVNAALLAMGKAIDESGLEKTLTELMKLRASQLNGCAFCTQMHLNVSRKIGVPETQLGLVAVWREAKVFSPREQAALAYTEALTLAPAAGLDEALQARLQANFSSQELPFLTAAIANINAWNRIAGALRFSPPL